MNTHSSLPPPEHSRLALRVTQVAGSALIISMLLLTVLSLLGVSAMRTTSMQERMAGNLKDRASAFQAAEAGLRAGEAWVTSNTGSLAGTQSTILTAWEPTNPLDPCLTLAPPHTQTVANFSVDLACDPRFHAAGPRRIRVNPGALPAEWRFIYPVTAHGVGGQDTSVVVVQSMFEVLK